MDRTQFNREREYAEVVGALTPVLYNLPGKLIAIDGRPGVGKTTLGRYLACRFNVSLIESDLFLFEGEGRFRYRTDEIVRIVDFRLRKPRPVILDGVMVLRLLATLNRKVDYMIYVANKKAPENSPWIEEELASYETASSPRSRADFVLELDHDG